MAHIDLALEILKVTNDGDDLDNKHLFLLQEAVNGHLTDEGKEAFETLHEKVMAGTYKSFFDNAYWGIENLRIDKIGYVYWKDIQVEHYNIGWSWSEEARKAAESLSEICKGIETEGLTVTGHEVYSRF